MNYLDVLKNLPKVYRDINLIVTHCSASPQGRGDDVKTIRMWHLERGWSDIGYHFVILEDGTIQLGRPLNKAGAHAYGFNRYSIGICLIGIDVFTNEQKEALSELIIQLMNMFDLDKDQVKGHYELTDKKTCPNINMDKFKKDYILGD